MRRNPWLARNSQIDRLRGTLVRDHYPRLQMALIVSLTGLAGLAASFFMLRAGLGAMGLRYLCAMGVAYIVFFLLLWIWLRWRADSLELPDIGGDGAPSFRGEGGTFDGGGASGDYGSDSVGDTFGSVGDVGDVGDAAIPLVVVALVVGIAFSSFFVIYTAPLLFAELLVDGVLAASLYRGLRDVDRRHWLESALRRTFWPFVLTTALVTAIGWGMGQYAPEAHSIGEVLHHRSSVQER
jgi:hypothetical protein